MNFKVKSVFPYSLTEILRKHCNPKCAKLFTQVFPPDYRKGRSRRYASIPEGIQAHRKIIKQGNGFAVAYPFTDAANEGLFFGTEEECKAVIKEALLRWWSLPRGREMNVVASEHEERRNPKTKKRRKK